MPGTVMYLKISEINSKNPVRIAGKRLIAWEGVLCAEVLYCAIERKCINYENKNGFCY